MRFIARPLSSRSPSPPTTSGWHFFWPPVAWSWPPLATRVVATETCRNHALKRVSQAEWATEDGPRRPSANRMLDDQAAAQGAPAGAPNYAYGW